MRPEIYYVPPTADFFASYVRSDIKPPLEASSLGMKLYVGDQRKSLKTPTTGEMSLVLSYKNREAHLVSFADHGDVLGIVQLQGATRSKGYRVATGTKLIPLFASQISEITNHPDSPYEEIYMPPVSMIEGVEVAVSELTKLRYEALALDLGLQYSDHEQLFVKKLR